MTLLEQWNNDKNARPALAGKMLDQHLQMAFSICMMESPIVSTRLREGATGEECARALGREEGYREFLINLYDLARVTQSLEEQAQPEARFEPPDKT